MTRAVDLAKRAVITTEDLTNIPSGAKNLIINGDMKIDQRNAGASVTVTSSYTLDRWVPVEDSDGAMTSQQVADAPTGFTHSLKMTTTANDSTLASGQYCMLAQIIEGLNTAHLSWGTANAKTVTLSFWVKSSLTGTFGGSFRNGIANRSYIFEYTISSANTWEQKSITIAGDTTGTWATNNTGGIIVSFGLGTGSAFNGTLDTWQAGNLLSSTGTTSVIGTNSATWQITGVQLEVGETATPFEHKPYDMELSRCWRYFYSGYAAGEYPGQAGASVSFQQGSQSTNSWCGIVVAPFPTQMRATPTVTPYSPNSGASGKFYSNNTGEDLTANASGTTAGFKVSCQGNSPAAPFGMQVNFTASAEL